eukprot:scaffold84602_cov75-Phaeocystis_antarctica.AAC.1
MMYCANDVLSHDEASTGSWNVDGTTGEWLGRKLPPKALNGPAQRERRAARRKEERSAARCSASWPRAPRRSAPSLALRSLTARARHDGNTCGLESWQSALCDQPAYSNAGI